MAEIAAVAVLDNPVVADPSKDKEVKALKAFFMEHLTSTRLEKLADVISQMMNPGEPSSIRSIREIGTTNPKRLSFKVLCKHVGSFNSWELPLQPCSKVVRKQRA